MASTYDLKLYTATDLDGSTLKSTGSPNNENKIVNFTYQGTNGQNITVDDADAGAKGTQLNDLPQTTGNLNNQKTADAIEHDTRGTLASGKPINAEGVYDMTIVRDGQSITAKLHVLFIGSSRLPRTLMYYSDTPFKQGDQIALDLNIATDGTIMDPRICFVAGSQILTEHGAVAVEDLKVGDFVQTKDHGLKEILWVGRNTVRLDNSYTKVQLSPIRIRAGALGENTPKQDLYVSQQHRILLKSKIAKRMLDEEEVLVPAKKLLDVDGIDIVEDCDEVTYVHFLFDKHEIVYSNGAETESLLPGREAMKSVHEEGRAEILAIFPELAALGREPKPARKIPSGRKVERLLWRMNKNNQVLHEVM